jgi:pimeloyl-ACP methyl ester carboxylesterase
LKWLSVEIIMHSSPHRPHSFWPVYFIILTIAMISTLSAKEGVILLHGLCRTSASMNKMEKVLLAAGYSVENVDYPSRTGSIARLSDEAIDRSLADPKLQGCSRIHFVTHSMGGILVRSYFSRHAVGNLGRVVMLGPPNRGSEVVDRLGSWWLFRELNGPAGDELGTNPDSTPNRLGPVNFELGVIAGDRSINWINSLMIKGPNDGKVSVENTKVAEMKGFLVVHVPHPFLMSNKGVIQNTLQFLKYGAFESGAS